MVRRQLRLTAGRAFRAALPRSDHRKPCPPRKAHVSVATAAFSCFIVLQRALVRTSMPVLACASHGRFVSAWAVFSRQRHCTSNRPPRDAGSIWWFPRTAMTANHFAISSALGSATHGANRVPVAYWLRLSSLDPSSASTCRHLVPKKWRGL
jgi:hypothetical protein